ncbi:MAG TPA: CehA/McbA family metallohydrolase [Candidatus Hydrogenedentes bacterium]|nr:CehA/McbA family metallohydrolase [Candidatus Hydrogenedentota bacterium]
MQRLKYLAPVLSVLLVAGGCAGTVAPTMTPDQTRAAAVETPEKTAASTPAPPKDTRLAGRLTIDVADVLEKPLDTRVDLVNLDGFGPTVLRAPEGKRPVTPPAGNYRAYVHVMDGTVPILVSVRDIVIPSDGAAAFLQVRVLEGATGTRPLRSFDFDGDLALDRVEEECGTDPTNPGSVPGRPMIPRVNKALSSQAGWYRGELQAYSSYSHGGESVAELVRRAEASGLDFLAVTDRGTVQAALDPAFTSERIVLIPALEWGNEDTGIALIYGPRTLPDPPGAIEAAQADCLRVQAQGGIFAVARPCFPTSPWQWNLSFVNAVQVWSRAWREVPPMSLDNLREALKIRDEGGKLIYSVAAAAAITSHSANAQAAQFWDYELVRGLKACAIAGSGTASPKVPMGRPITYVYAREKSLEGILEGLRLGRTFVSSGPDGPRIVFNADVMADGKVDVGIGGTIPLGLETLFEVNIVGAAGKKMQVLQSGRTIISKVIEGDNFFFRFPQRPKANCNYRVRVTAPADAKTGFGPLEVLAMSSPIYAQDIIEGLFWQDPNLYLDEKNWIPADRYDPVPKGQEWRVPVEQPPLKPVPLNR